MRAVIQRVSSASVCVPSDSGALNSSEIGRGLLVLIGVRADDSDSDALYLADKIAGLRIFEDDVGKMNLSVQDVGGSARVVSNFTLFGDCRKGRRPSFTEAASGSYAERLYRAFGAYLEATGVEIKYGTFGAHMAVTIVNDGPVTLLLDSRKQF